MYRQRQSQPSTSRQTVREESAYDDFPQVVQSRVTRRNIIDIISSTIESRGCMDEDDLIVREIIAGNNLDSETQQQICDAGGLFPYLITQTGIFILHEGRLYLKDCDMDEQLYENSQQQKSVLPNESIQPFNKIQTVASPGSSFLRSSEVDERNNRNDASDAEIEKYKNEIRLDKQHIESLQMEIGLLRDSSTEAENKHAELSLEITALEQHMDNMKKELETERRISAKASRSQLKLKNDITKLEHNLMISSVEVDQLKKSNAELSQTHLESLKEIEENKKANELLGNELGRLKMFCFDIKQYEFEFILNKYKDIVEDLGDCLKVEHSRFAGNVEICQKLNEFVDRVRIATEWFIQEKTRVDTVMSEIKDKFSDPEYELKEEDFPNFELQSLPKMYIFYQDVLKHIPKMYLNDLSSLEKMSIVEEAKPPEINSEAMHLKSPPKNCQRNSFRNEMKSVATSTERINTLFGVKSVSSICSNATTNRFYGDEVGGASRLAGLRTTEGSMNKLLKKLVDHFPNTPEEQLRQYVRQYKESRGSLNGIKIGVIIEEIKSFVNGNKKIAKTDIASQLIHSAPKFDNLPLNGLNVDKVCSICLEELRPSVESETVDCGHIFHSTCIKNWMTTSSNRETHNSCPNCRAYILSTTEYPPL